MRLLREASSKGSPQSAMGMAWTWEEESSRGGWGSKINNPSSVVFGYKCANLFRKTVLPKATPSKINTLDAHLRGHDDFFSVPLIAARSFHFLP